VNVRDNEGTYDSKPLGERIRALRKERGWTQAQLARERIDPPLSTAYLSDLENGSTRHPSVSVLERIAAAFGLKAENLLSTPIDSAVFAKFLEDHSISPTDREMLRSIRFEHPPMTTRRWRFILAALRSSVALDDEAQSDIFFSVVNRPDPETQAIILTPSASGSKPRTFEASEWLAIERRFASPLPRWQGSVNDADVLELVETFRTRPSMTGVLTILLGSWAWLSSQRILDQRGEVINASAAQQFFDSTDRTTLEIALSGAWKLLRHSGSTDAYQSLIAGGVNHVEGLDPVVCTAFLFFAGHGENDVNPRPLVLNPTIAASLTKLTPRNWTHDTYGWTPAEYGAYVSLVGFWRDIYPELETGTIQRRLLNYGQSLVREPKNVEGGELYS